MSAEVQDRRQFSSTVTGALGLVGLASNANVSFQNSLVVLTTPYEDHARN
jgi:hypothetical protein